MIDLIERIELIGFISLLIVALLLSNMWNVYFYKKIVLYSGKRRDCLRRAENDPSSNFNKLAEYYKIDLIYKYALMLAINITEFVSMLIYGIGMSLASSCNHNTTQLHNCTLESIDGIDLQLMIGSPIASIVLSIGQVGIIFSFAFGICLMKYLHFNYHGIVSRSFGSIKRILSTTLLIGVFLIISGSIPQLVIIHRLIEPIIVLIYFSVWVKNAKNLYKTLKWRIADYRARSLSKSAIRESIASSYLFLVVITLFGIGSFCLIIGAFMVRYFLLFKAALLYGPCLFNYLYGTPYYEPLITTQRHIEVMDMCSGIMILFQAIVNSVGSFLIGSQYILATLLLFGGIILKKLKLRFGKIRTRFTPAFSHSLRQYLI